MKLTKKIATSVVAGALTLSLAACGSDTSPKESFTQSFSQVKTPHQYKTDMSLAMKVDGDMTDPQLQQMADVVNNSKISATSVVDDTQKKSETNLHLKVNMGGASLEGDIPMLLDEKQNKLYVGTDSLVKNLSQFIPIPPELAGKLLEVDLDDQQTAQSIDGLPTELSAYIQSPEFQKDAVKEFDNVLKNKKESEFTKDSDGNITVTVTKKDLIQYVKNVVKLVEKKSGEDLSKQGLSQEDLDKQLNKAFESIKLEKSTVTANVDGDDLKSHVINVKATILDPEDKSKELAKINVKFDIAYNKDGYPTTQNVTLKGDLLDPKGNMKFELTSKTKNSNFGKKQTFKIDPSKEETITPEQIEAMMGQMQ
ncbi:hypothetical protein [Priestia koreensis]|uniref:Lipoprotein n=1 Tax=Priestia koreensis TaxID=284581 RepID=A0A0M0KTK4_9BACI|nr:hypothetical protein [Priestia koreensis]KOO41937.1 hypothetical protein AMD01_18840 [Priestia koreensis]